MLHMLRQLVDDDEKWRGILRGLNSTFWHQTVTGAQVQAYISKQAGADFSKIFQQYLTTTKIPVLEYKIADGHLSYRWTNTVPGFAMPVRAAVGDTTFAWLRATSAWKALPMKVLPSDSLVVDKNFYVDVKRAERD